MSNVSKRTVTYGGVTYHARREALKRDGGDPPGQWYWTVLDASLGCCIDERVPMGYWPTLGRARDQLASFLGIGAADLRRAS
jgi:hypothetical protein